MIVIASHPQPETKYAETCVASCEQFMPTERITVIETDGHYETGAWWQAYREFPEEPFFYFLHDSTWISDDLAKHRRKGALTVPGTFLSWEGANDKHQRQVKAMMAETPIPVPDAFWCAFGSMFFAERAVLAQLDALGFSRVLPTNKLESECMERCWGIAFGYLGFRLEAVTWGMAEKLVTNPDLSLHKVYGHRV